MKYTAHNKRFGVSRGVRSQKVLWEFESLSPVRTFVFPRPNAKPPPVVCNFADSTALFADSTALKEKPKVEAQLKKRQI